MTDTTKVYWTVFEHPVLTGQRLYVAATREGLCRITWPNETAEALQTWAAKKIPGAELVESPAELEVYVEQLAEYLEGRRTAFTLPCDLRGTPFQVSVWNALRQIPHGETRSYSEIAAAAGSPDAVRAVGTANGANPVPIVVPCHRVIGKNAALTGFRGGLQMKELLLELEGVQEFVKKGHARFQF